MSRESQYQRKIAYNNNYIKKYYRSFSLRFNIKTESDIIHWLEKKKKIKSYITGLIREDMKKNNNHQEL